MTITLASTLFLNQDFGCDQAVLAALIRTGSCTAEAGSCCKLNRQCGKLHPPIASSLHDLPISAQDEMHATYLSTLTEQQDFQKINSVRATT
jgi:hypothetical protein